jgi:TonB family protein
VAIGQNRCLVIADHLQYPLHAWRNSETGPVQVDAVVSTRGIIIEAKVREGQSSAQLLRDSALKNVQSWRFEPGDEEQIAVTYSFDLRGSPDTYPRSYVSYDLPNKVTVTANPPR